MEVLAVCHVHSNWSYDGSWTLQDLSRSFRERGYRVLMMTEHDLGFSVARFEEYRQACAHASCGNMLVIPGIEYSDTENRVHVLVWGNVPFLGEGLPTVDMLERVQAAGGAAVLAHPSRRNAWKSFIPAWADKLVGIEVWNRKYDGWAPSRTAPDLLGASASVQFVGLDFHTANQFFPLGMALEVEGEVSEETIVKALLARRCFPRAFQMPFQRKAMQTATPLLRMAESSRRTIASLARRSGILPAKRPARKKP